MGQSEKQKPRWFDKLKIIIEIVVILLMAWGLRVAFKANETSRAANKIALDALRNSYVPWLSVTGVGLLEIDPNSFKIAIHCKNFSNAPALKFDIKYNILGETVTERIKLYDSDALMPNYERELEVTGTVKDGRAGKIVEKLKSGEFAIEFEIHYEDIFGRKLLVHQGGKYKDDIFRTTKYEIDGIDALFEEIE